MTEKRSYRYKSLLGIELDAGRMTVVSVARNGHGGSIKKAVSAPLSLDPLTHDPELVGQEIRNRLDALGIHESRCVICVPLPWILSHTIDLPDLPPSDEIDYLRLQAEREFPFSAEDLSLSVSRFTVPGGKNRATLAAIPSSHIAVLQKVFKAAKLRPVSLTIGIASLQNGPAISGKVVLRLKESGIEFLIRAGNGIAALRCFQSDMHLDDEETVKTIVREIRISLGQLDENLRKTMHEAIVYGTEERFLPLLQDLQDASESLNLTIKRENLSEELPLAHSPRLESSWFPLAKTTLRFLSSEPPELEFLPPQVSRLQQISQRVTSKGNLVLSGAVAAIFLLAGSAFLWQHVRLLRLETEWNAIENPTARVEALQQNIKKFRPWYVHSANSLSAIKILTEAFPEEGTVWAKLIQIQDPNRVTCSGFARSNGEWLAMVDRLNASGQAADLLVQQKMGEQPLQFVFNFRWVEGSGHGQ